VTIPMCETHQRAMIIDLFGEAICPDCIDERVRAQGSDVNREPRPGDPEWFTIGSTTPAMHIRNVRSGRHPLGAGLLHDPEATCGSCQHRRVRIIADKTFFKCSLVKDSHGPGTDIRLKWAACELWKRRE
jgi:hypothetical protein